MAAVPFRENRGDLLHQMRHRRGIVAATAVASGSESETASPVSTSLAEAARFLSVIKLSAPRSSSLPQRPQLLHFSKTPSILPREALCHR